MKIFEITLFGLHIAPSYYGLMYVLAFLYGIYALEKRFGYTKKSVENIFIYIFLGVLVGGRLGYVLFYNLSSYLQNPIDIVKVWEGGMAFHGGLLGVIFSLLLYARKHSISYPKLMDDIALLVPVGLFFGRIGNYLNKELLGFPYTGPLAVETSMGSYFPSPLVEALLEGVVLFIILNFCVKRGFDGKIASLFLILYGVFRIIVEIFFRTPDPQIGYYFGFLTQGFFLSLPMCIAGTFLYYYFSKVSSCKRAAL